MAKKRTNNSAKSAEPEEQVVAPTTEVAAETPATEVVEPVEAEVAEAAPAVAEAKIAAEPAVAPATNTANTTDGTFQDAKEKVIVAAKGVANYTVDQIKAQLGEEKTQMAVDYANKARTEVMEVVDYARETVEENVAKARTKATTTINEAKEVAAEKVTEVKSKATEKVTEAKEKVNEVKEKATEKVNEVKSKATEKVTEAKEKVNEVKEKATEKVNETVGYVKHVVAEKSEKPRQKVSEATAWLQGDVAETPLEHTTVDVATFVVATTLTVGNTALGLVGLNKTVANVAGSVSSKVAGISAVQTVHGYASAFWPYRLAARMIVHVSDNVKERMGSAAPAPVASSASE